MSKPIIYPYKLGSKSAKALAEALGTKRVKSNGKYKPKAAHVIINWGSSNYPNWINHAVFDGVVHWLNPCWKAGVAGVRGAGNKLLALQDMQGTGVSVPEFTTDKDVADGWLQEGEQVVERELLRASAGRGIRLVRAGEDIRPNIPMYVKYVKKKYEYRVHVFRGKVIDVQQKKKRNGVEDADFQIRNHENGWVFCREGVVPPDQVLTSAVAAVAALGLDFGAADVIWNEHHRQEYVLEVNTAPGLEGTTLTKYVEAVRNYCNEEN